MRSPDKSSDDSALMAASLDPRHSPIPPSHYPTHLEGKLYQDPDPIQRPRHKTWAKRAAGEKSSGSEKLTGSGSESASTSSASCQTIPALSEENEETANKSRRRSASTNATAGDDDDDDDDDGNSVPNDLSPSASPPPPLSTLRTAIRNFSSQWFLIPQGTGITSVVLYNVENRFAGLDGISFAVWAFTGVSLVLMLLTYATRAFLYPRHVRSLLASDAGELACLSSASIALTSINQMVGLALTGGHWADLTIVLFWINTALAISSMVFIPYAFARIQSSRRPPGEKAAPPPPPPHKAAGGGGIAWLSPATQLPMVAAITLAAGGGVVAGGLGVDRTRMQVPIVMVSYLSLALAMPMALAYAVIYLARLLEGSSPPARSKVYQEMIFCGPWGQGSFALQVLGRAVLQNQAGFAGYAGAGVADVLDEASVRVLGYGSVFLGLLSWGQGTFWWCFASMSCVQSHFGAARRRWRGRADEAETYSLAVWSLVFPWGVYTNAAIHLGKVFASAAFKAWSTVLTACLVVLMLVNLGLTAVGLWDGSLLGTARGRVDERPQPQQQQSGLERSSLSRRGEKEEKRGHS